MHQDVVETDELLTPKVDLHHRGDTVAVFDRIVESNGDSSLCRLGRSVFSTEPLPLNISPSQRGHLTCPILRNVQPMRVELFEGLTVGNGHDA